MRIAFRTDVSNAIGSGHMARCLTLADALAASGHHCHFVTRDGPGFTPEIVTGRGHGISVLPPIEVNFTGDLTHSGWLGIPQTRDADDTVAVLGGGWDWIVVDHYALDHRWQSAVRDSGRRILAIDDLADRSHDCDLLLDQNPQSASARYSGLLPSACTQLLGPRFALLRPEFACLKSTAPSSREGPLLVYFGGVDNAGATLLALEGIELAGLSDRGVVVVAGALNPHLPSIRAWVAAHPGSILFEGSTSLAELIASSRGGIGAAGATALERCCLALPTVVMTIAANQRPGAAALAALPAAIWLGDADRCDASSVAAALTTMENAPGLADSLARNGAALVDGEGTKRVVRAMEGAAVTVRHAAADDCDKVWGWRNHPATRERSLDSRTIPLADHRAWFTASLVNEDRRIFIAEMGDEGVGVIRFDRVECTALVSIFVAPERIGKGLGTSVLAEGCMAIRRDWPELQAIDADIMATNPASRSIFMQVGFRPHLERLRIDLPLRLEALAT